MGEDNNQFTLNPVVDTNVKESNLIDLWNRITPINSTRIGDTTVVNGKQLMNENKTFNSRPLEEISKQYLDTSYEVTQEQADVMNKLKDDSAPYFYELENVDTGVKKYGIAPKGLEHRYAGQNMSQWKVNYNKRRTDAIELEKLIHGNEEMLKRKVVDLGLTKNTQLGKGASEIYTKGLLKATELLNTDQKQLTSKLLDSIPTDTKTKSEEELTKSPDFISKSKSVLNAFDVDTTGKSDKEITDEMLSNISDVNWNLTKGGIIAAKMGNKDPQVAKDFMSLIKAQGDTDINLRQVGGAVSSLLSDPFSYVTLASAPVGIPARMIGQTALQKGLQTEAGRMLMTGAVEGGAQNWGADLIMQKLEKDAELRDYYDTLRSTKAVTTGALVGGGLGGALGKLFQGNEKNEQINKLMENFLANKTMEAPKTETPIDNNKYVSKEEYYSQQEPKAIQEQPKKFDLASDVELRKQSTTNTKEVQKPLTKEEKRVKKELLSKEIDNGEAISKEEYYQSAEPKLKEKKKNNITTKSGTVIDSKEVLQGKKTVENIEFDVSSPATERKPIEGNEYIPETNNPKKFKLKYDDVGRVYTEDANLLSFQGTPDQKASLKQRIRDGVTNADDEVNRRLEFFNRDTQLRERYGKTEASFDKRIDIPKSKADADRLRFQIEQYKDIKDNTNLTTKVRREAKNRLKDLYESKVSLPKAPEDLVTKAEQKFIEENPVERISNVEKRNKDLKEEFELFKKTIRNKEGYEYKPAQPIEQVVSNTIKNAKASKLEVVKAIQKIKTAEARVGNKDFSVSNITPEIKAKYRDDITKIENYTGALEDVVAYQKGILMPDEFMFRARRRVDDEVANSGGKFKSEQEVEDFITDVISKYENTGTRVDRESVKTQLGYEPKGGIEKPEAKKIREDKEKLEASKQHNEIIKKLKEFSNTGNIPRYTSGQKAGKQALNSSQMRDVKEGILSFKEIANKTSPVSTRKERKDAVTKAREFAAKKVNEAKNKKLGTQGTLGLPNNIVFKDTVKDASNSVAQIITVLLGSKRLAGLAKLLGTDADIRSIIGAKMGKDGVVLPKDKDGNTITWKDVIKPLFMTGNYGQMEKGLVNNLMKAHNFTLEEATAFYKAYEKASDDVAPDMKLFKDAIYDLYHKNGKAKLSWVMPDGFPVNINLSKEADGTIRIRDNELKVNIKLDTFNDFSRAIMPRLVHSVDAYVARMMNKAGFPTTHDAFTVTKGNEKAVDDAYTKIMANINDSDLLHDIMKSIGYKGESLKQGTLTRQDIENSPYKLGNEHVAGEAEASKPRKREEERQLSDEEVMRDFMASKNYRQIPTGRLIDAMVNESGYNNATMSVAREGDDVFERQMALAFQSPEYNKNLAIPAPKGVDEKMWNKVQEEIFIESRAKLEYHPWLAKADILKGERKWFDKDGRIIGKYNKTYAEIYEELYQEFLKQHNTIAQQKVTPSDKPLDKVNFRFDRNSKFTTTLNGITNKETFVKNVDNILKQPKDKVLTLGEVIVKTKLDEAKNNIQKSKWQDFKNLWNEQVLAKGKYEEFNLLQRMKNVFASEVDRDAEILYKDIMKITKAKRDDLYKLLKSDYEAIEGMTKKQADEFFKDNNQIYTIARREIDQGAKGLSSPSERYGAYLNNSKLITERHNLPEDAIPIIDQLISIKAMDDNKAWDMLDKYGKKDDDIKYIVDIMRQNRMISETELFNESPEKIIKGYFPEVYRGNKKINDDGKVVWDADSKYEQGVLGAERENNKIGTKVDIEKEFEIKEDFKSLDDELEFMTENRLKKSVDGYRKVADEDIRIKAGKTDEFAHVITETVRASSQKVKERGIVFKVLADLAKNESKLFSKEPKEGMTKLTFEQLNKLPFSLRQDLKYVDMDLMDKLLGRDEVRLYDGTNEHLKIADRLLNNLGTMFKQNVVLKNVTSYINAFLVNQAIGASLGMTPAKMYKYQRQALADLKEMNYLLEQLNRQKITGKKLDRELNNRLQNNILYKLEKKGGLSTNRVDGVVGDNDLLGSILEKHVPSPIFKLAQKLNLNQNTTLGRETLRTFSKIDTMGRYTAAMKYIDDGLSITEACDRANGLFGNMDIMVPKSIELLDKYGIAPFLKWFSLVHPMLVQITKEKPANVLAVAVGIYVIGQELDLNLASVNPIEGALDFMESTMPFDTIERLEKKGFIDTASNRATSNVVPRYLYNIYRSPDTLGAEYLQKKRLREPKSEKQVDYRGFTQKIVENSKLRRQNE